MSADAIIAEARRWIGTPYRHQASLKGVGCDCLGLVRGVWRELIGGEPEITEAYTPGWAELSGRESLAEAAARHCAPRALDALVPADIVLFRWRDGLPARHCGILTAPDSFIHAHDGLCVTEVALSPWWRRHLAFGFVFPLPPISGA